MALQLQAPLLPYPPSASTALLANRSDASSRATGCSPSAVRGIESRYAIHEIFDAGHGDKLFFGMDHGYCSETGVFEPVNFMPPSPWTYMFTDVLPAFRAGLAGYYVGLVAGQPGLAYYARGWRRRALA